MAIPKKGSRKIVVDDVIYRWRIRWKPTYDQDCHDHCLCAAVELYENPQNVLHIAFSWARYNKLYPPFELEPVTPKHIEAAVKDALKEGWSPTGTGNFQVVHNKGL